MPVYSWSRPNIQETDSLAVARAVDSTWVSGGNELTILKENLRNFTEAQNLTLVSNGTTALAATFLSLDLEPGDEVIVPAFGFMAAANVLIQMGATPIFADVNEFTWCIDKKSIEKCVSNRTKAVVITHSYGNSDQVEEIAEYVQMTLRIPLVEDAAEALGSRSNGKAFGTFGDFGTYSFHATKLITTGEGGAIAYQDNRFAEKLNLIISHGLDRVNHYLHQLPGTNYRMPNLCAALGNSQFSRIGSFIESRREIDDYYRNALEKSSVLSLIKFQTKYSNEIVPWSFPVQILNADLRTLSFLTTKLESVGIEVRPGFKTPNFLPYLRNKVSTKDFPISYRLSQSILSLPAYPYLKERDVQYICKYFVEFLEMIPK